MASLRRQVNTGQEAGGYVQRCVILNRDENGYGLTVSGDNPVYVQSVKENSPSSRSGVQVGDKIIKVNGASVTNSNHVEVVNLIKSGNFVALTLLGRPPSERASSQTLGLLEKQRPLSLVNINKAVIESDEYKVESLQRNLDQEKIFFQKTRDQYIHDPSPVSQKELADSQIRIRALEEQLKALSSGSAKPGVLRTKTLAPLNSNSSRKLHQQHQRSQSVAGTRSSPAFKPPSVAPDSASNHRLGHINTAPAAVETVANHSSLTSIAKQQPPVNEVVNQKKEDSTGKDSGSQSDESLWKQISESQIDYNSVPVQKQKVPKRSVSLRSFSKFYERHPERQPTLIVKPTISPPIPISPPVVHSETQDIVTINHARSKSDELSLHTNTKLDKDDEPLNSVSSSDKSTIPTTFEEAKMEGSSLLPGSVIETLQPVNSAMTVISMEEEEFDSDNEKIDDHGPFVDLNLLKSKPAHLSVFLHFVMANSDPSALFFWLVTEIYAKEEGSLKDLKKWAYEIFSTFLAQTAPLKVCIPETTEQAIAEHLKSKSHSEDDLRNLFRSSRAHAFLEVSEQLGEFRTKRALGLGSIFGDHQLEGNLDREKELKVVEQTLIPHLENLTGKVEKNSKEQLQYAARNSAMASSITTFMKHVGVSPKTSSSQLNPLELHRSFAEKERSSLFRFKNSKKVVNIKGHQFVGTQYTECTLCNKCEGLLWGIGTQGMQCQSCEYNVHKGACMEAIEEPCSEIKRKLKVMERAKVYKPTISKIPGIQKGAKPGKFDQTDNNDVEGLSPPNSQVEMRSRGNSFNEDQERLTDQQSEEQTLSDQETDKTQNKSHPPLEETSSEQITRDRESKRAKHDFPQTKRTNLTHSQSVSGQRDFVRLIDKDRKKTVTSIPGLKLALRQDGLNTDNGVYTAQPFQRKAESPSFSDDEEEQDDDLEVEDIPCLPWSQTVEKKTIKKLKDKEVKRQEVIHELINTEKTHVRHLKVLEKVFLKPMKRKHIMPPELIQEIFPNLEELIEIHTSLLADLNTRCAQQGDVITTISDIILARFDGAPGEKAKEVAAAFNQNQRMAMEMLKNRIKKDQKLAAFMARQEESKYCRRLKFNDIMANTHQRLTKYPLLVREMLKSTSSSSADHKELERCKKCCLDILDHVNKTMKETENKLRLIELSKKIDMKALEGNTKIAEEFKDFDLTKHKLIHEGDLTWRINRAKTIELHVLLLDLYMILLQKQDDKLVLKSHSTTVSAGAQDMKTTHSPIIKLQSLLTRDVATDKRAFFLVITSSAGPQIYELVTSTITERTMWVSLITECAEKPTRKSKERGRRGALCLPQSPSVSLSESIEEENDEIRPHDSSSRRGSSVTKNEEIKEDEVQEDDKEKEVFEEFEAVEVQADEKPKQVFEPPSKERMAELLEQLRIKDDEIKTSLEDKARIIAELRCQEFGPTVTLESSANDNQSGARDIIFAAILQADRLTKAVSQLLTPHHHTDSNGLVDMRTVSPNSSIVSNGLSREDTQNEDESILQQPQEVLVETTAAINEQLTSLMRIITEEESTIERLRSDLQESQSTIKRLMQTNSEVASETGESPDVVPSSSMPSLGSFNSNAGTPTQAPGIFVVSDDVSEDSSRSEVFDEAKSSDNTGQSSPIQSISSDDPVLMSNPFKSPRGKSIDSDPSATERVERSLSFPGSTRPYNTER